MKFSVKYLSTICWEVAEPLNIKLSYDSNPVDCSLTKSIFTSKLGALNGTHLSAPTPVNTTDCNIGNALNSEIQRVSFLLIFVGNGSYSFNTTLLFIWPSGTSLPNSSFLNLVNVVLSTSQFEIIISLSSISNEAKWFKYFDLFKSNPIWAAMALNNSSFKFSVET